MGLLITPCILTSGLITTPPYFLWDGITPLLGRKLTVVYLLWDIINIECGNKTAGIRGGIRRWGIIPPRTVVEPGPLEARKLLEPPRFGTPVEPGPCEARKLLRPPRFGTPVVPETLSP